MISFSKLCVIILYHFHYLVKSFSKTDMAKKPNSPTGSPEFPYQALKATCSELCSYPMKQGIVNTTFIASYIFRNQVFSLILLQ